MQSTIVTGNWCPIGKASTLSQARSIEEIPPPNPPETSCPGRAARDVALCALLLLALLAVAAANTEFFDRYYSWLYAANAAVALILTLIVGGLAAALIVRLRQGRFGTRLLAKLAVFFTLVGV